MKKNIRTRIIAWSIVSGIILAIMLTGITSVMLGESEFGWKFSSFKLFDSEWLDSNGDISYSSGDTEFPAEDIRSLKINWGAGEVIFTRSSSENIVITEENRNSDNAMKWKLENGVLTVKSGQKGFGFFFSAQESKTLVVNIPEKTRLTEIKVNTASASVTADHLDAFDVKISTASGNIQIDKLDAQDSHIENVSGATILNGTNISTLHTESISGNTEVSGSCKEVHMESVSGNLETELGKTTESVKTETVSGDTRITLTDTGKGFTFDYESVSGAFSTPLSGETSGKTFVYGDGKADVHCESVSGNFIIDQSN